MIVYRRRTLSIHTARRRHAVRPAYRAYLLPPVSVTASIHSTTVLRVYCYLHSLQLINLYNLLLGPFYGAIAVPSVTRCRCRRRSSSTLLWTSMRRRRATVATPGEWPQHFSNASCFKKIHSLYYRTFSAVGQSRRASYRAI